MKTIIMILYASIFLIGCGMTQQLARDCGGDFKYLCRDVFGGSIDAGQDSRLNDLSKKISELEQRVAQNKTDFATLNFALSTQGMNLQYQIDNLTHASALSLSQFQMQLFSLNASFSGATSLLSMQINTLQNNLNTLSNLVEAGNVEQASLQALIVSTQASFNNTSAILQMNINTAIAQIAVLQGYKNIVAIKDPCGKQGNNYNEVFLKLSDGSYIASFSDNSSGKNTRFVVLEDGQFVTSDGTSCQFTVSDDGKVISNEHN